MKTYILAFVSIFVSLLFACTKPKVGKSQTPVTGCFTASRDTLYVGDTAVFTNCSVNVDSTIYNFGDGSGSNLSNPSHVFLRRGVYSVSLCVSNHSQTNTVSKTIVVKAGVPSNISWRYFAPGSNTDSMVFWGTGQGTFYINGQDFVIGRINVPGYFTLLDSFNFAFATSDQQLTYNGNGSFSKNDSSVNLSYNSRYIDQSGVPSYSSGTFYGIRQ